MMTNSIHHCFPSPRCCPPATGPVRGAFLAVVAVLLSLPAPAADTEPESAAEVAAEKLLDALEERRMPDVAIWVLDRLEKDPETSATLRSEVPFRRAGVFVMLGRLESDTRKRTELLDRAEREIDRFLAATPSGMMALEAYTQKGNLLIERGRANLEQARRPGEDPVQRQAEAVSSFDAAIKLLEGPPRKPGEAIEAVTNAEDAVLKELRNVDARIAALEADPAGEADPKKQGRRPVRRTPAEQEELLELEERQESLRAQLLQTRLLVGGAYYEKSRALAVGSKEWKAAIDTSAANYRELAEKYRSRAAGLFARYYEGRNYAVLAFAEKNPGARKVAVDKALATLADLRSLSGDAGVVPVLRAKAIKTSLECWLDAKAYESPDFHDFDDLVRHALAAAPADAIDADWLGLKYQAAVMLERRAEAISDKARGRPMLQNAKKLALEVARFNREHAAEARALLERLGRSLPEEAAESDASFGALMDSARISLTSMQARQDEIRQAVAAKKTSEVEAARAAAAADRERTMAAIRRALPLAGEEDLEAVNQARSIEVYLLYDARRFHDAAALGGFLAERYPNARGSRQSARIAMASWQQLAKDGPTAWRGAAKDRCVDAAGLIIRTWPNEAEAAEAAAGAIAAAAESHDPQRLVEILEMVPETSPRRAEVGLRAGTALWREVLEKRRLEPAARPTDEALDGWRDLASRVIDAGLSATPAGGSPDKVAVAAALARCQMEIEKKGSDNRLVDALLTNPVHGPWTAVVGGDPAFGSGPLAESILTAALRYFIQSDQLDKAQQAMDRLEVVAGSGEEASARLTGMYLSMGRDLQAQLEALGSAGRSGGPGADAKAASILAGFEKFLDGVAKRDKKVSSQIWVATTYSSLGSGAGTRTPVPRPKAESYLTKAVDAYEGLLRQDGDEITRFEPSIRLKLAGVYRELGRWADAQEEIDWILSDPRRQNSLDAQIQAAELLQAAGERSADKAAAVQYFRQAIAGRTSGLSVVWGWGGIGNRLARQAFSLGDQKSQEVQARFFMARLNVAKCRLKQADASLQDRDKLLQMAANDVALTYKLYPDLGGPEMARQFDSLLREIERQRGNATSRGLADLQSQAAGAAP